MGNSCIELNCCGSKGESRLLALDAENLIAKLSKERKSRETARAWGTVLGALFLSGKHGTSRVVAPDGTVYRGSYSETDYLQMAQILYAGMQANQFQAEQESNMIRYLDRFLFRPKDISPGDIYGGWVLFPFRKSDSYKICINVSGEKHEVLYLLRQY